jgi:uncharacterized protein
VNPGKTTKADREEWVRETAVHVRTALEGEGSGHDWWHVERVWKTADRLAREEGADHLVVDLAALLHDLGDWKFHGGDDTVAPRMAREWLEMLHVDGETIDHVCEIVGGLSFKGAGEPTPMGTLEGKVVQDADRLDALGAIGIARAFAYGGHKAREIHNPEVSPTLHATFEEYRTAVGTTINHFHEKLLLLKDRMNTRSGRALAEKRHRFMEEFLERFHREWEGKA